jgi:hypothetical protein
MGKVGVHEERGVSLGTVGSVDGLPEQFFDTASISDALAVAGHCEREDTGVALEHFSGGITGTIVQHQKFVLPGEAGEYLAHLPEKKSDGWSFVVARYADVNHDPSRE